MSVREGFLEEQLSQKYKIAQEQLEQARKLNAKNHLGILTNLQQLNVLTEQQVIDIQVECFGARLLHLKNQPLKAEIVNLLPEEVRNKH